MFVFCKSQVFHICKKFRNHWLTYPFLSLSSPPSLFPDSKFPGAVQVWCHSHFFFLRTFVFSTTEHMNQKNSIRFFVYLMIGFGVPFVMTIAILIIDIFKAGSILPNVGTFRCFLSAQVWIIKLLWINHFFKKITLLKLIFLIKNWLWHIFIQSL